eukprot:Em0093g1a
MVLVRLCILDPTQRLPDLGSMVLVRLCILDLTQRLPDLGSMVLVRLCILDLTQRLPDLGSMVLVRLCILDLTQRLPDLGSMVLVRLCILDLTQRLPDLGSMVLVLLCILDLTQRLPDLGSMVLVRLCILDLTQRLPDLGSMVLVRLCILDLTQRLPDMGSMVLVRLCILDLTQRLPDLGSMVLVRLCILDSTQRLPDMGSMVLVRLCILDLTQRLPDLGSMVLVRLCILDLTQRLPDLGRTKYNIDPARFVAVLIDRGQPPLEASRKAPCGYWFLVAVSLSGCSRPSDKYVLAVYKYWRSNRGNLHTLLGELNDSTVTIPLEGDEIVPGPETNDVDEVEEGIIRVPEEEGDRTDALQACEKEDTLIQHGTAESTSELPLRRDDKGVKMESLQLYCLCQQPYDPSNAICYNEASVRLYHEIAKSSPLFCDATGRNRGHHRSCTKTEQRTGNSSNICWLNAAIQALFTTPLYTMMKAMMSLSKASLLEAFVSICNDLEGMVNHPCDPANLATFLDRCNSNPPPMYLQKFHTLGSMVLVRLWILDLTQRLPDLGSMVLVRLCILDLTQRLPDMVECMMCEHSSRLQFLDLYSYTSSCSSHGATSIIALTTKLCESIWIAFSSHMKKLSEVRGHITAITTKGQSLPGKKRTLDRIICNMSLASSFSALRGERLLRRHLGEVTKPIENRPQITSAVVKMVLV